MSRTLSLVAVLSAIGCGNGDAVDEDRPLAAGVVLVAPAQLGALERPAVAFPHDRHTKALVEAGCQACHPSDAHGRLSYRFARLAGGLGRDQLTLLYHEKCMGCHAERTARRLASGPVTCGECHRRDAGTRSARRTPRFDLPLHSRHVVAARQACETCHHVADERAEKRVYRKGAEEACRVCHGPSDQGRRPSLQRAAHQQCVTCHLDGERKHVKTGPVTCEGCHGGRVPAALQRPATVVRLLRGQRDRLLLSVKGARAAQPVGFDHVGHEKQARFCTECHHHSLASCPSCHPPAGAAEKGGGVLLESAHHRATSTWSCVGCHRQQVKAEKSCAGCHQTAGQLLSQRSCPACHLPAGAPASRTAPVLAALPPASENDFPEKVEISLLAREYKPSTLPHRKIVMRLDAAVRKSRLATALHGSTEVLCAGCHHHSPLGKRPPACRSCHGGTPQPRVDRPALQAAYHRQCMGCHAAMGLKQGCTDCHAKREVSR